MAKRVVHQVGLEIVDDMEINHPQFPTFHKPKIIYNVVDVFSSLWMWNCGCRCDLWRIHQVPPSRRHLLSLPLSLLLLDNDVLTF